jgi:hypothetical protein
MADPVACTNAYTDIEEDFFRAGDELSSDAASIEIEPVRETRKSLWSRLFERPLRLPSEVSFVPSPAPSKRAPSERPMDTDEDDEWDWTLAIARARARTQPGF